MSERKARYGTETEQKIMRRREKADLTVGEVEALRRRIEELERSIDVKESRALQERYDWLLERWDAIPWEEIEEEMESLRRLQHPAALLLRDILKLRQPRYSE